MTQPLAATPRPSADKREALLAAARRLIARAGLHATPTSAIAREAGVAHGTLFLYFPTKDALLNALYLELVSDEHRAATTPAADAAAVPRAQLWASWRALARWYIDHPEVTRVIRQLRGSGVLTAETRAAEERAQAAGLAQFREAIARGALRDLELRVFWALYAGPMLALAEANADHGATSVSDAELRTTFAGVCRSILPPDDD